MGGSLAGTGCGTGIGAVDLEEAAAWFADVGSTNPGFVGGGPSGVPAQAPAGSDIGVTGAQITQTFTEPIDVASVSGLCFGGGQLAIYVSVSRSTAEESVEEAVPCDGEPHELVGARTGVVGLGFGGWASGRSATYYAVVVDEARP